MHDIICPNCGERFLGYDVAFDMASYVLPLLCRVDEAGAKSKEVSRHFKSCIT